MYRQNQSGNQTPLELMRTADEILARAGYDINGREKGDADFLQSRSERMYIKCPFRGSSRRGR